MKISSASKKVLASALSAAMVVAFAPTMAFGAASDYITDWEGNSSTGITDASAYEAGYAFKTIANSGGRLIAKYYKAEDVQHATGDITMLGDVEITSDAKVIVVKNGATLNLNGHKLSSTYEKETALLTVDAGSTVKNGTVEAANYSLPDGTPVTVNGIVASDGAVTVKDVTADSIGKTTAPSITMQGTVAVAGAVAANKVIAEKSAKVTTGAIVADVEVKEAASLEATVSKKKDAAVAISGTLTFAGKNASVVANAETTGNTFYFDSTGALQTQSADATAIGGQVTMGTYEGVSLTATAKTTGTDDAQGGKSANAVVLSSGSTTLDAGKNQTLKLTASVADSYATAVGFNGSGLIVPADATVEISAKASTDNGAKDIAVKAGLQAKAGTYTGKVTGSSSTSIQGGTYTMDPAAFVDSKYYDIIDNGDSFTVKKAEGFALVNSAGNYGTFGTATEQQAIADAVIATLDGKTGAATLKYAEGYDLAKARDLADGTKLKLTIKAETVAEKRATAAQKTAFDALTAYAEKNESSKPAWDSVDFTSAYLFFNDAKNDNALTKVADLADFGATGTRNSKANSINITGKADARYITSDGAGTFWMTASDYSKYVAAGNVLVTADEAGTVTPVEFVKGTDGNYKAFVASSPLAIAELTVDMSAIKDDVKPGESEEISELQAMIVALQDEMAADKAKGASKTVKLAKGVKKTKKAQTVTLKAVNSASGATMAFKKASGSKYVTVKGTKATLKKGVKKGTYKATVTATVGASTKNVTVKFVVK